MIDLCCCFKKNNKMYNRIENKDDTLKKINTFFKNKSYIAISDEDLYDVYIFVYKTMTKEDFNSYKFRDVFIINLYEAIYLKYGNVINGKNLKYVTRIFSKLITLYLFTSQNNLIISTNFLINNNHLFDIKLWLSLLTDPKNNDDEHYLYISLFLIKNNIIDVEEKIDFYNLNYTFIEYLIIGKIKYDKNLNKIYLVKFIDKNIIIKFINDLILLKKFYVNSYIFTVLNDFHCFENVDSDYINNIMLLLKLVVK